MTIMELDNRVDTLRELQATIEALTTEAEAIKDEIKAKMIDEGTEELTGNGWKATWHTVTSTRLDTKALKASAPEIFAKYATTSTVCRFVLA